MPAGARMRLEDQTSKLQINDSMNSADESSTSGGGGGGAADAGDTSQNEATPAPSAPGSTQKAKRVRTGCLTCRERHLKCDETLPTCHNCRKSNRFCKRGVRLNFIDTQVRDTNIIPRGEDWQVNFMDESRNIASEYRGGAGRYPTAAAVSVDVDMTREAAGGPGAGGVGSDEIATGPPAAPVMSQQQLPPIQTPSSLANSAQHANQFLQSERNLTHQTRSSISSRSGQPTYASPAASYDGASNATQDASGFMDIQCLNTADETLYMQVFVEEVGLWMDSMDPHKHFSRILPFYALSQPMLLNAFLACGARHLTLVNQAYGEEKALHYYDTATRLLLRSLQNPNRDTIICATAAVILNVYEVMCERALQRMNHIAGARALIKECGWSAKSTGIGAACFWLNVGMELFSCLHFNWQLSWNPDEWGVDMDMSRQETRPGQEEQWTYKIVYVTAKMANFRASIPKFQDSNPTAQEMRTKDRIKQWEKIKEMAETWNTMIPRTMHPMAYLAPNQLTQLKSNFPEVWIIKRATIIARLFYHTTMCLLPQTHPTIPPTEPDMYESKMHHARTICGIVTHVKDRGVASAALRCVAIAAECLETYEEQEEILKVLEKIHKETGWGISFLPPELKKTWGWTEHTGARTGSFSMHQQLASAATGIMQSQTSPNGHGMSSSGGPTFDAPSTLAPVQAPSTSPQQQQQRIESGIVNPLLRTADFSLEQHPYQNEYVPPNHPSGPSGGLFTRLTQSGVYNQQH